MFSPNECKFLLSNARDDLKKLEYQLEYYVDQMSAIGAKIQKMQEVRAHLKSIIDRTSGWLGEEDEDDDE